MSDTIGLGSSSKAKDILSLMKNKMSEALNQTGKNPLEIADQSKKQPNIAAADPSSSIANGVQKIDEALAGDGAEKVQKGGVVV
jgi:hypothetical protein